MEGGSAVSVIEKVIGHGGPSQINYGTERPKYRQLRTAIQSYYGDLLPPLEQLREQVLLLAGLQAAEELGGAFSLSTEQRARINEAVERMLVQLAGPVRTREGFVAGGIEADTPDGIIQARNQITYAVGLQRGARLLDTETTLTAGRKDPAVTAMLDRAFERLSENGKLRLEGVKDEIQGTLVSATEAGLNPLETARQLSGRFDQYSRYEFERLARTEAAFAAEQGTRNQLREFGVTHITWLTSAGSCPICTAYEGQIIPIEDEENSPPGHPQCACSASPYLGVNG
ncbi:MAG TPA: minor capsid protein [Gemmatimonadales bacterium]|nr:minor capsid protein [Gemmatimonadales bacterium]